MRVTPLKIKILRQLAFLGAPLLWMIGAVWPGLALDPISLSVILLALLFIGLLTFIDPAVKLYHRQNLVIVILVLFTPDSPAPAGPQKQC